MRKPLRAVWTLELSRWVKERYGINLEEMMVEALMNTSNAS